MPYINRVRTPMSDLAAWNLVDQTLSQHLDDYISPHQIRMIMSLLAFEHGAGADTKAPQNGRACWNLWNWNWGNRRGGRGDLGAYYMVATELDAKNKRVEVGGGWPAFSSAEVGLVAWYKKMEERFPQAWRYLLRLQTDGPGSCLAFATHLKRGQYYTDTLEHYAKSLETWHRIWVKKGWI